MKIKVLAILAALAVLAVLGQSSAWGARGDLVASYTSGARKLTLDPITHRVYASNTTQNSIGVYGSLSLAQIGSVAAGSAPMGAAVSPDGTRIYVADSEANAISVIDAVSLTSLGSLATQWKMWDVEAGSDGYIYATQGVNSGYHGIIKMNASTGQIVQTFGGSYNRGMLEISPDRRYLYYSDRGLSPATATDYDISTATPSTVKSVSGLGSNGQELTINHSGSKLYWGLGGWSGFGYQTPELNTSNMQMNVSFLAPQVTSIAVSPTDRYLYTVSGSNGEVRIWDLVTYTQIASIAVPEGAWDLAVNETGTRLFVAYDNQLRIYDTGFAPVPEPASLFVLSLGVGLLSRRRRWRR